MNWLADAPIRIGVIVALIAGVIGAPILGFYESIGGALVIAVLWIVARVFQKSMHDVAEAARANVTEQTGLDQPSTNPLSRVFHETEPPDARSGSSRDAEPARGPAPAPPHAPTVDRQR